MPKQKVRQSVETAIADKTVEPAPLCDDMPNDFMGFSPVGVDSGQ